MAAVYRGLQSGKSRPVSLAKEEAVRRAWGAIEAVSASLGKGVWQLLVWRLPKTPGGHATFHISIDGQEIRVIHGK